VPSGIWPLIFPRSQHLYTDHRRPAPPALPDAGFSRRPATALVEGQLVEYEPVPGRMVVPMVGVGREDPCSLALTLRLVRGLRGMKQAHAAELLGVTQSSVSRIERGELKPTGILRNRLLDLVSARIHPARDAALRRLIEGSGYPRPSCLRYHYHPSAACRFEPTRTRMATCRRRIARPAAVEICERGDPIGRGALAGPRLGRARWCARADVRNWRPRPAPAVLVWERILLSDGSPARLVTSTAEGAVA
jgi:transcriptional regulator with XRE-family HTH domain